MAGSIPGSTSAEGPSGADRSIGRGRPAIDSGLLDPTAVLARLDARVPSLVGAALVGPLALAAVAAPLVAPYGPFELAGPPLDGPSVGHPLGTDPLGRDVFSIILHGARASLTISVITAVAAGVVGLVVGMLSGYLGGRADNALMRVTELVQILPRFFLAIVGLALFGSSDANLIAVLALSSWPVLGRAVRAEVLTLRERDYVLASHVIGSRPGRILTIDLLPALWPTLVVLTGLLAADIILVEASLGFLGLGDPNRASWGLLAATAQQHLRTAWWLPVFPGLAIVASVLGINLLAGGWANRASGRARP